MPYVHFADLFKSKFENNIKPYLVMVPSIDGTPCGCLRKNGVEKETVHVSIWKEIKINY